MIWFRRFGAVWSCANIRARGRRRGVGSSVRLVIRSGRGGRACRLRVQIRGVVSKHVGCVRKSHGCRDLVTDGVRPTAGGGVAALRNEAHVDRRLLSAPGSECTSQRHGNGVLREAGCLTYTRCVRWPVEPLGLSESGSPRSTEICRASR